MNSGEQRQEEKSKNEMRHEERSLLCYDRVGLDPKNKQEASVIEESKHF